jgi:hypothetical protein
MPRVAIVPGKLRWSNAFATLLTSAFVVAAAVTVQFAAEPPQSTDTDPAAPPIENTKSPYPPTETTPSLTGGGGQIEGYLAGGRWREGSKLVDVQGQFRFSGDRVTFFSVDGKSRFACLENLNSERVARIVEASPEALDWVVQGTLTEYGGENYLLVTQAVIRSRAGRSTPTATSLAPRP